jgi:anti-sigma regulatory factor (Ser/Thr protein kinase)
MKRLPPSYFVATGARWGACAIIFFTLWRTGALALSRSDGRMLLLCGYIVLYALIWTLVAPRFWVAARDGSIVVLYDLLLSALPVWLGGGWESPFLPFALTALIVPALGRGWLLGAMSAAAFLTLDQLILWTTSPNPQNLAESGQGLALIIRTLLPFVVVGIVFSGAALERWYRRRRYARAQHPHQEGGWSYDKTASNAAITGRPSSSAFEQPELSGQQQGLALKTRIHQRTLEQQAPASVELVIRQIKPALQAAGVALQVDLDGDERRVPQQIRSLLSKVIQVAVDNIITHAHAHNATITLFISPHSVWLQISDDGIGLLDGTAEPPGFHQIKRLRYRVEELDGHLRVEERSEGGVILQMRVPIE